MIELVKCLDKTEELPMTLCALRDERDLTLKAKLSSRDGYY